MSSRPGLRAIPVWVYVPAVVGLGLIVLPPVALAQRMPWATFWSSVTSESSLQALALSMRTAAASTLACLLIGVPMAVVFARADGMVIRIVRALVLLPLVLPPVVGGIALLYAFGRRGLIGEHITVLGADIAFSTTAVVMAQTFVALPFLVISVEGALRVSGSGYERAAATLGAGPTRTLLRVTLPLVFPALISGVVLAFARSMGEFGATITFAGNSPGVTQTAPLKIYVDEINDPQQALPLSLVLVVIAFIVVVAVHLRRPGRRAAEAI